CVIYERQPGQSRCYNYGTAEFSDPLELGWKFLRGTARFWVSQWRPGAVVSAYQKSDRSVWRQQLALGPEATQKIVERLEHDAAPKNRYYRYHHFDDNCATRLRDIIDASTQGALRRHHTEAMARSFRELTAPRLADQPGLVALGSVLTGRRLEQLPTFYEGMFLPEVLRKGVYDAFGAEPELVYARRGPEL